MRIQKTQISAIFLGFYIVNVGFQLRFSPLKTISSKHKIKFPVLICTKSSDMLQFAYAQHEKIWAIFFHAGMRFYKFRSNLENHVFNPNYRTSSAICTCAKHISKIIKYAHAQSRKKWSFSFFIVWIWDYDRHFFIYQLVLWYLKNIIYNNLKATTKFCNFFYKSLLINWSILSKCIFARWRWS